MPGSAEVPAPSRIGRWLRVLCVSLPIFLLIDIWLPEIRHDYVPGVKVTTTMLEKGRQQPSDAVFSEISKYRLLLRRNWKNDQELLDCAEKLLGGRAEVPGYAAIDIHLPFSPSDLDKGSTPWQLEYSGLIVPEILLDAYQITGREEFYFQARDAIVDFANFEAKAWLNHGFLWNDHALAARVRTLAEFWRIYRGRPDYRPVIAQTIWRFAARTGQLLAKPDRFTFATNHGVMQNLALWQLSIAFPSLPGVVEYTQIAFDRLKDELAFEIGPDGVVLEHSAGYQEFGLYLTGLALRYATLLNLEIPLDWVQKYEKAKDFYGELRRPDGSLPMFGDTEDSKNRGVPIAQPNSQGEVPQLKRSVEWHPRNSFGFYPVAGYTVLWGGLSDWPSRQSLSQTVLLWSNYPEHGHKHADELSVLLWADGQDWWTNAGYWPYDDPDRSHAECWEGSNAPHLAGENCDSGRAASLMSYYYSDDLSAIEMQRRGPSDFLVRRLVVHVSPNTWIVADNSSGGPENTVQTLWTTEPEIKLEKERHYRNAFTLSADTERQPIVLNAFFFAAPGMKIGHYRGSNNPFAGWVTRASRPNPTDTIMIEQASRSWCFTVWILNDKRARSAESKAPSPILQWSNEKDWRVSISVDSSKEEISRRGESIVVRESKPSVPKDLSATLLPLSQAVSGQIAELHTSYQKAANQHRRFPDLAHTRFRASALVFFLFILQECSFFGCGMLFGKYGIVLSALVPICWLALGLWLQFFRLQIPSPF